MNHNTLLVIVAYTSQQTTLTTIATIYVEWVGAGFNATFACCYFIIDSRDCNHRQFSCRLIHGYERQLVSEHKRSEQNTNMSTAAKFKVGDIVCQHTYPGRDHWQQVSEVIAVTANGYKVRHIQFRTSERDWSTTSNTMGTYIPRGDWPEEQTTLFYGKTLEQEKHENDSEKEKLIRKIVREELALQRIKD
jgi:hypothetical protein